MYFTDHYISYASSWIREELSVPSKLIDYSSEKASCCPNYGQAEHVSR